MASTSTSSIQKSFKYDVFLSFRGEDTRKNFVDHLHHALRQKDIKTYKDDEEIKKGRKISDELIKSIEESKFYIIVFSKNYASSSWCLDELVKIIECQKTNEHTAYPVFYDVKPTEVRKQSGAIGEAFAKHRREEDAGKWREALREAADLSGWELKNTFDGHEVKFIQKIVEEISLELRLISSSVDGKLIGMETRVDDVISCLKTGSNDAWMIGIRGMGGGGKTTLARAVFDKISNWFEGKTFVENIREISKASHYGLKLLQKQVLSDVLNDPDITISSVYDGKNMMKKTMSNRKVLVVLDDVDHIDQLEALAGEPNWFKSGSRVIITTRDEQVLVAYRVKLILNVNLLSHEEAICLFSRYAFGREIPIQGYEELSEQVLRYAAGLPLTIRVLGSFLCGKNELEWIDSIERLKTIPLKETLEKLELSYNGLEDDYKEMFLDVACILKGLPKDYVIRVLESCGFHARNGLRVLEQKSLITISGSKYHHLGMHDHIEEMGKNIVRCLYPDEPSRHSRLWIKEEAEDILANDLGTEATKCITMPWFTTHNLSTIMRGLESMKKLRILNMCRAYHGTLNKLNQQFPNALRYLSWQYYPFGSLPESFQADNLVGIEMPFGRIAQLWEGGERKVLNKLKFLNLTMSCLRTFDLGMTPNLEMLNLEGCTHLVKLHMTSECPKLKFLSLSGSNLRTLDLGLTPNLEMLSLSECYKLVKLHMPFECPKLKSLILDGSTLRTLNLGPTPALEILSLLRCCYLVKLHMPFECPKLKSLSLDGSTLRTLDLGLTPGLEILSLSRCCNLVKLHMPIECPKLNSLNLNYTKLTTIDLKLTPNLETLFLAGCCNLVEICMPDGFSKLKTLIMNNTKLRNLNLGPTPELETLGLEGFFDLVELHKLFGCPKLKSLCLRHSKLRALDLGLISNNLERLDLRDCYDLVELRAPVGCLKKLVYLNLTGCGSFKSFLFDKHLESMDVGSLSELHLIAEPIDTHPFHPENNLSKLRFTCLYEEQQLSSFGNLEHLISIGFSTCGNNECFSTSICSLRHITKLTLEGNIPDVLKVLYHLECLEKLTLLNIDIKNLPDTIFKLKHLKSLELDSCRLLEKLPEDVGVLECMEELILRDCILLQDIPNSICNMKRLKYFCLVDCESVEKLPEEIGCLECLQELNIEGTNISHLPRSIFGLEGLCIVGSRWLLESWGFASDIQIAEHKTFCYIVLVR